MGSSYVQFKGRGFWSGDGIIEVWLRFLIWEIDKLDERPEWLQTLREKWDVQAKGVGVGVTWVGLDDHVTTDERKETVIALANAALATIEQFGEEVPKEVMETIPYHEGIVNTWTTSLATVYLKRIGTGFLKLLKGEYKWTGLERSGRIERARDEE